MTTRLLLLAFLALSLWLHFPRRSGEFLPAPAAVEVAACWENGSGLPQPGGAGVQVFSEGRLLGHAWCEAASWGRSLAEAKRRAQSLADFYSRQPEAVLVTLGTEYRRAQPHEFREVDRGVLGLQWRAMDDQQTLDPLLCITQNTGYQEWLHPSPRQLWQFRGHQYEIKPKVRPLFRGRGAYPPFNREETESFYAQLSDFLVRSVRAGEGRLRYMYIPAHARTTRQGFLLIRPVLGTWALATLAKEKGGRFRQAYETNLEATLDEFYREDGTLADGRERALGPLATLCLAMRTCPSRDKSKLEVLRTMEARVESLWQPTGELLSYFGSGSRKNQDYYPGEAMVSWAERYRAERNPELLRKFRQSFLYYRDYYRRRRAPAIVPWQTMALVRVANLVQDREMEDFVFEMNDDLLEHCQPKSMPYPDLEGAFFTIVPSAIFQRVQPYHASSTSVYLDGLIEAWELARARGQSDRAERYRQSMLAGLASLRKLQFRDDEELPYFSPAALEHINGGLRSTPWDSRMRVDNEPHAILALSKILRSLWEHESQAENEGLQPHQGRTAQQQSRHAAGRRHPTELWNPRQGGQRKLEKAALKESRAREDDGK